MTTSLGTFTLFLLLSSLLESWRNPIRTFYGFFMARLLSQLDSSTTENWRGTPWYQTAPFLCFVFWIEIAVMEGHIPSFLQCWEQVSLGQTVHTCKGVALRVIGLAPKLLSFWSGRQPDTSPALAKMISNMWSVLTKVLASLQFVFSCCFIQTKPADRASSIVVTTCAREAWSYLSSSAFKLNVASTCPTNPVISGLKIEVTTSCSFTYSPTNLTVCRHWLQR